MINSVFLSSLLKFWVFFLNRSVSRRTRSYAPVLNYKCPNKCVFYIFLCFIYDFLEFPSMKSSKISQHIASSGIRILNTKIKAGFVKVVLSILGKFCLLPLRKNLSYRFPWKTNSDYIKIFTTSLPNFREFHWRKCVKIRCQFCFLYSS